VSPGLTALELDDAEFCFSPDLSQKGDRVGDLCRVDVDVDDTLGLDPQLEAVPLQLRSFLCGLRLFLYNLHRRDRLKVNYA